jgi:hypothetical protein
LETEAGAARARPKSRMVLLVTFLNVVLLGGLLYKTFGQALTPSGGVAIALFNNTPMAMNDLALEYPGGKLSLPSLGPAQQVGQPIADVREFDATLSYKDEDGNAYKETVHVKPLDELLILVYVEPVLTKSVVKTAEGKDESVFKAVPSKVRIFTAYQRPWTGG